MDLLTKLDKFFIKYKKAINLPQLIKELKINKEEKYELEKALYQLQLQGKIYLDEYGNYLHVSKDFYLKSGTVKISNRGNFYIKVDDYLIHLKPQKNLKVGDYVFVEEISSKNKKSTKFKEGIIKSIVTKNTSLSNETYLTKGTIYLSEQKKYHLKTKDSSIEINKEHLNSAYPGDIVTAEIKIEDKKKIANVKQIIKRKQFIHTYQYRNYKGKLQWVPLGTNYYPVELQDNNPYQENDKISAQIIEEDKEKVIIKSLGKIENENTTKTIANQIIENNGFFSEFSEIAKREAKQLKEIKIKDGREDYTALPTFTIDSSTAKDFDDAISIEKKPNGNYILYVHIADVSYYVKKGSTLAEEAYQRGTSVYLENYVFPMFPEELSNDLCSLNPNEIKATKTCKMEINKEGKILDFNIHDSIICSNKRMIYDIVDTILEYQIIPEDYRDYMKEISLMQELSNILQYKKLKRGYTNFCHEEANFHVNEHGYLNNITIEDDSPSRQIIENFMLVANETVANYLYHLQVPALYRNHEAPKSYHLDHLIKILKENGYWNKNINTKDPFFIQKLLKRYRNNKEFPYLSRLLLNTMQKAYYAPDCRGHYGLSIPHYVHFTSPIRRYPDLQIHETLNKIWSGEIFQNEDKKILKEQGIHLSNQEIASREAEKEYKQYLLNLYVNQFLDQTLEAEIVFIDKENIYLRTTDCIEGIIYHNGDFDKRKKEVSTDKKQYHIGDKVNVTLNGFSKEEGNYIFELTTKNNKNLIKTKKQ